MLPSLPVMPLPEITEPLQLRRLDDPAPSSIARRSPAPRDEYDPANLTRRQKLAIENALKPGMTKKAALLKAGYSVSIAEDPWSFFNNPIVAHEFKRRKSELFRKLELTTEDIVDGLRRQAEVNVLDYYEVDPENPNRAYVDLRKITQEQAEAIQGIEYDAQGRLKLIFESKKSCRELLGKYLGLGDTKRDGHLGSDRPLTVQALDNLIKEELARQKKHGITINNTTINVLNNNSSNDFPDSNEGSSTPATIEAGQ